MGIDEAGRGALAGPVAVGALILPVDRTILDRLSGVRDSKKMTPSERGYWAQEIKKVALAWSVGFAEANEIDDFGIVPAVYLAAERALKLLSLKPDYLLIDYFILPENDLPQTALVKGDNMSLSIAGASVLAKTTRDALMISLEKKYSGYSFARHKGYGTRAHRLEIVHRGKSEIHRNSFTVRLP